MGLPLYLPVPNVQTRCYLLQPAERLLFTIMQIKRKLSFGFCVVLYNVFLQFKYSIWVI